MKRVVTVVAALITNKDKFLICQRPQNKARGLLWEFVGGKVEQGESKQKALVRECQEELGITVQPLDVFIKVDHKYPDIKIHLVVFNAVIVQGEITKKEHNDIRWITPAEIDNYEFCPADKLVLEKIKAELGKQPN